MPLVALVAVDKAALSFDRLFFYLVPAGVEARAGCRVLVPFGAGNRKRQGMVFQVSDQEPQGPLKPLAALLDGGEPLLDREMLALAAHLRNTVFCTYYEAVRLMIPAGLDMRVEHCYLLAPGADPAREDLTDDELLAAQRLAASPQPLRERALCDALGFEDARVLESLFKKGVVVREEDVRRRVLDEKITMVRLTGDADPAAMTAKQRAVAAFLEEAGAASLKEACYWAGVTRVVVDNMKKKGLAAYFERETYRNPYRGKPLTGPQAPSPLSGPQARALEALARTQAAGAYAVSLLYGVTGSGKTQVFLRLAQSVVAAGRGVLVLVPEISLTPQTIDQFHAAFGGTVAVIHSALSLGERLDEYKRIRRGEARVVVGTRSAVFAPVRDLGLIVLDEEQEMTYKSEKSPRFHARDVAKWRAHYHRTQLVLASATPSVESYYFAQQGKYRLVELGGRFGGATLPDVYILDMAGEETAAGSAVLSGRLCEQLQKNLQAGEQSILLLNRRGYHTVVKCGACGQPATCPNCSVSLTYHSANDSLCCHYCGYIRPKEAPCPCGGSYARYQGVGTQRVEEELRGLFPAARVLRMDMDTTMSRFSHEKQFAQFAAHEYDIMVGTQMVAKGLNFPDVTLVGVLCTDQSLYGDDFRSFERTFSLITQAVGRAGRGSKKGRAYIQTYSPDNPVIELAATQQYARFFAGEIGARRLGLYPPFCAICALGVTSQSEEAARQAAASLLEAVRRTAAASFPDLPLRILGPSDFAVYKMAGKYRRKLLIKCKNTSRFRAMLRQALALYEEGKRFKKVGVFVDMYYDSF